MSLWVDTVEKIFWGGRTKFSRAADAFRAQRCERPRRFSEKRPRTFVLALRSIPAANLSKNQHLRDFWSFSIFDFFNSIGTFPTCLAGLTMSVARGKADLAITNADFRKDPNQTLSPSPGAFIRPSAICTFIDKPIRGLSRGSAPCLSHCRLETRKVRCAHAMT